MTKPNAGLLNNQTLAQQCAEIIFKNIVNMQPGYEPGSRLNAQKIAAELGISETPLKVAFKLLESQGVLTIQPRKGTYVAQLSKRDIEELLAVRAGLEVLAVRLGQGRFREEDLEEMEKCLRDCEQALAENDIQTYREQDERFHRLIVAVGRNNRLKKLYQYLTASEGIINAYSPRTTDSRQESTQEHWELVRIFRSGDMEAMLAALERHWESSQGRALGCYRDAAVAEA